MPFRDFSLAWRALRATPATTAIAVVTCALGIALSTTIVALVEAVLLTPLPFAEPSTLAGLATTDERTGRTTSRVAGPDFEDARGLSVFRALTAYSSFQIGLQIRGAGEFVQVAMVAPSFFDVFGVEPIIGRRLTSVHGERTAVVSNGFARRHFGSPDAALDQAVTLDGAAIPIVGVVASAPRFPAGTDVWISTPEKAQNQKRESLSYRVVGRLADGTTLAQAQAALDILAHDLSARHPDSNRDRAFEITTLGDQLAAPVASTLWFLFASAGLLLCLAAANVSNVMLARTVARRRELAVRLALGGRRGQILRVLWAEALWVAIAGGALGAVGAVALTRACAALAPADVPALQTVSVSPVALALAAAIGLLASLLFTVAPAWQALRLDAVDAFSGSASRAVAAPASRLRLTLLVAQIALAVVLGVGAALMARTLVALDTVPLGFERDRLLVAYAHAPAPTDDDYRRVARALGGVESVVEQLPGVERAAVAMGLPAGRYAMTAPVAIARRAGETSATGADAGIRFASPGYFATLGIPVMAGRSFSARDAQDAPKVAIVSARLARELFGDTDPIGHAVQPAINQPAWATIVGVVGDVRQTPASEPERLVYLPLVQWPPYANEVQIIARVAGPTAALAQPLREAIARIDPTMALRFVTMEDELRQTTATPRLRAAVAMSFWGVALLLATIGIFASMSLMVQDERRSLGVRAALGASPRRVAGGIVRRGLLVGLAGSSVGLAAAVGGHRLAGHLLFGVTPNDPIAHAVSAAAVLSAAFVATLAPAWRAARADVLEVLRID